MNEVDIPVENLRNLGHTSATWLREIGVYTRSDLERIGPVLAYRPRLAGSVSG
jgi:DNA transformation protein and related proteins